MKGKGKIGAAPPAGMEAQKIGKGPATGDRQQRRASVLTARDLVGCLDAVEAELRTYDQVDCYAINLYQPNDNMLVCARLHLPQPYAGIENTFAEYSFPLEDRDASTIAFQTGETVRITDKNLAEFSERTQLRFIHGKMRSFAVLPIQPNGPDQPSMGTLVLISQQCVLPASLLAKVRKFLDEAAPILQLHRKAASLEARNYSIRVAEHEVQSLLHFISEINSLATERDIYPRIEREFMNRFDLDFAAVLIAEDGFLRCADTLFVPDDAPWGKAWREHCARISYFIESRDSASSNAFINNQPFFFGDIPSLLNLPMGKQDRANLDILTDLLTFSIHPIRKQGRPIGVLWLGSMRRRQALTKEQLVLIQQLSDFLGGIIDNARLYSLLCAQNSQGSDLTNLASWDRLTGLYNFGSFDVELSKRLHAFRRHTKPATTSLIMADIDRFRDFNEQNGYVVGNAILREVARRITETVRDSDFVARHGGEKFAVLLHRCDLKTAVQRAERIRQAIARKPYHFEGRDYELTMSLGCAEFSPRDTAASIVERAHRALEAAKADGRNRVAAADGD